MDTEVTSESLIEQVRKHECLYDINHADYKNRAFKEQIWRNIAGELCNNRGLRTVDILRNKWKNIRDAYAKSKKQVSNRKTFAWSKQLTFLDPFLAKRANRDNNAALDVAKLLSRKVLTDGTTKRLKKEDAVTAPSQEQLLLSFDSIDHLFLSYAKTFKTFPARTQSLLKIELAQLFSQAELNELEAVDVTQQILVAEVDSDVGEMTEIA